MKHEICNLCDKEGKLAESHVIPKFVFKWMKKSGGNYFRSPSNPNQRMQDGIKKHLLCDECEQIFSKSEKWFAENIFYPHLEQKAQFLKYNNNLSRFIISILWRYLLTRKVDGDDYPEDVYLDWKSYLNNNSKLKYNKIHFMLLPDDWGTEGQPNSFVNRYFNRATDMSIIESTDTKIIYAKFSRFILCVDVIGNDYYFRGTNVLLEGGRFPFAQFIADKNISEYFVNRAEQIYNLALSRISVGEIEKMKNEVFKNPVEFLKTDLGKTVSKDFDSKIIPFVYKKELNYNCDCCLKTMEEPDGFLLRTFEVIQSEEYWKFAFGRNNFTINDDDLSKRVEYFKEIASSQTPWVICEECITKFNVDHENSKLLMEEWISKKGNYFPPKCDDFRKYLTKKELEGLTFKIVTV